MRTKKGDLRDKLESIYAAYRDLLVSDHTVDGVEAKVPNGP